MKGARGGNAPSPSFFLSTTPSLPPLANLSPVTLVTSNLTVKPIASHRHTGEKAQDLVMDEKWVRNGSIAAMRLVDSTASGPARPDRDPEQLAVPAALRAWPHPERTRTVRESVKQMVIAVYDTSQVR